MMAKLASSDINDLVPTHQSNTTWDGHEYFQSPTETGNHYGCSNSFPLLHTHLGMMGKSNAAFGMSIFGIGIVQFPSNMSSMF